jgi:hypothetical protein
MIEQKPKSVPKKGSRLVVLGGSVYAPYLHTPNQKVDLNHVTKQRTNRKVGLINMIQWETNQKVDLLHETISRTTQNVGLHHVTTGRANQNVEFLPRDQSKIQSKGRYSTNKQQKKKIRRAGLQHENSQKTNQRFGLFLRTFQRKNQ